MRTQRILSKISRMYCFWTSEKKFFDVQIFLTNYWINLVDAGHMEDISCFQTDLQKIMGMLKCKNKGDDLRKYMEKNKAFFEHLDYNTSQAIGEFLQSEQLRKMTKRDKRKGEGNMCKAIDEIYQNGIAAV